MNQKDINHEYTDGIVCPFCGYEFNDSWEFGEDREEEIGLIDCEECEKSFYAYKEISITYSTHKADYGTCQHCKADNVVIENLHSAIGKYSNLCIKCGKVELKRLEKEYFERMY